MEIIGQACSIGFCVFIGVSVLALLISIFTSRKAYGAFFLGLLAALVLWSIANIRIM